MTYLLLFVLTWQQVPLHPAKKCAISSQDSAITYAALWDGDTLLLYHIFNEHPTLFYELHDSIGVFSISSYDSILIMARKIAYDSIQIIRFVHLSPDTIYSIHTKAEKLLLYNDGYIHQYSFPIWYMVLKNDSGLFMTHSSDYGTSFYPLDTVLIDTGIINFDFTTSLNNTGDRLHIIYEKKITDENYLYLLNGSYPASFTTPILIDSMIPDTGHFSIYATYDTVFVAYERLSSSAVPDPDIFFAVSYHEGDTWQYNTISADTVPEKYPVIIPAKDSLKVFFIDDNYLYESVLTSPYNTSLPKISIYQNNFSMISGDKTSYFPAILSIDNANNGYFVYDDTYSTIRETKKHRAKKWPKGVFSIDGRKIKGTLKRGIYIKNGKKEIILR